MSEGMINKLVPDAAQTVVVAGLGATGYACLEFLVGLGQNAIVVIDNRPLPPFAKRAGERFPNVEYRFGAATLAPEFWAGAELLVVSPGIDPFDPLLAGSEGVARCSDIDLFMSATRAPVIGITGTNGKSTVTSLVGHMLEQMLAPFEQTVKVGGNLGEPALCLLYTSPSPRDRG